MLPKNDKAIWITIFLSLIFWIAGFIFLEFQLTQIKTSLAFNQTSNQQVVYVTPLPTTTTSSSPLPSPIASPTVSPKPTTSPKIVSATSKPSSITYIPLSGGSTNVTDWVDIASSQFTLNISDYGSKAYAVWDANLHVDNANGTTFARIFDKTHSIAVNGSEISISDTSQSTDVISGSLQFWQGNNTYVVQLKSLNSSVAFMDSGRIKITY